MLLIIIALPKYNLGLNSNNTFLKIIPAIAPATINGPDISKENTATE